MSGQLEAVSNDELHAYVDGALDAAHHARVAAYLTSHPDEAERAHDYARLNEGLRALGASFEYSTPAASSLLSNSASCASRWAAGAFVFR